MFVSDSGLTFLEYEIVPLIQMLSVLNLLSDYMEFRKVQV